MVILHRPHKGGSIGSILSSGSSSMVLSFFMWVSVGFGVVFLQSWWKLLLLVVMCLLLGIHTWEIIVWHLLIHWTLSLHCHRGRVELVA